MRLSRLHEALDYAAEAHQHQTRKGTGIPYLSHVMGVSSLILEHGGDEEQAIAGLLHDVLEDCGPEHEAIIRSQFGDRVAEMVLACTDGAPDEAGRKPPWRERKESYLRHLEGASEDALLVSACDKLHNARSIARDLNSDPDVFGRFVAGRVGAVWYYTALVDVFARRLGGAGDLVSELRHAVARFSVTNIDVTPRDLQLTSSL